MYTDIKISHHLGFFNAFCGIRNVWKKLSKIRAAKFFKITSLFTCIKCNFFIKYSRNYLILKNNVKSLHFLHLEFERVLKYIDHVEFWGRRVWIYFWFYFLFVVFFYSAHFRGEIKIKVSENSMKYQFVIKYHRITTLFRFRLGLQNINKTKCVFFIFSSEKWD